VERSISNHLLDTSLRSEGQGELSAFFLSLPCLADGHSVLKQVQDLSESKPSEEVGLRHHQIPGRALNGPNGQSDHATRLKK
jgi:hypothetical protein